MVHWITCVLCDWLEELLRFWFYDTQLKTALSKRSFCFSEYRGDKSISVLLMPAYAYAYMFGEGMVVVSIKCLLIG